MIGQNDDMFLWRHIAKIDSPIVHNNGAEIDRWEYSSISLCLAPLRSCKKLNDIWFAVNNEATVTSEVIHQYFCQITPLVTKNIVIHVKPNIISHM